MKLELQAKFLQHLNKKKQDEGFTLIELLVVIIIIGILAAIALPSFLNQANKAKQSEAKTYTGSMNRAQQAYYLENDTFVGSDPKEFGQLGLGIAQQTVNYKYLIVPTAAGATGSVSAVTNQAQPLKGKDSSLKAYIGGVAIGVVSVTSEATTLAKLCEGNNAPLALGPDGTEQVDFTGGASGNEPICPNSTDPAGYKDLGGKTN
jgi:prepilin-type N-terminal cleavage/methylation domain-containing protein